MKRFKIPICLGVLFLAVLAQCTYVQASLTTFGFDNLPQNTNTENGIIGASQLFVTVSDELVNPVIDSITDQLLGFEGTGSSLPDGEILFTFYNSGDYYCSIVDIYFYDGVLLANSLEISEEVGVEFTSDSISTVHPAELPGTEYLKLVEIYSVIGSADSDPSQIIDNGIESIDDETGDYENEWLSIVFKLQTDDDDFYLDFDDVIAALSTDEMVDGRLVIGLRVHFDPDMCAPDGEEQFVNCTVPIPAPGAVMLGGLGVVFVGWLRRKRTL